MSHLSPILAFTAALATATALAQGFKFSDADKEEKADEAARAEHIRALLQTPCRNRIKDRMRNAR